MKVILWVVFSVLSATERRVEHQVADPPAEKKESALTVTYPVADLVVSVDDLSANKKPATTEDLLITRITNTVTPDRWAAVGGEGTIRYVPESLSLVIVQNKDVHRQVAELLDRLRKERPREKEYTLELKLVEKNANPSPFPRITFVQGRWFTIAVGQTVVLKEGTIRDLSQSPASGLTAVSFPREQTRSADQVQLGWTVRGKATPAEDGRLRLDLILQSNDFQSASRQDLVMIGYTIRTARRLVPGRETKQVIHKDSQGRPVTWIEMKVTEVPAPVDLGGQAGACVPPNMIINSQPSNFIIVYPVRSNTQGLSGLGGGGTRK